MKSMEWESTQNNPLYQRIFDTLDEEEGLSEATDELYRLRNENAALKRKLRLQQGLRQRFEQLFDSAPSGFLTLGGNGYIVEANLTLAQLLGISRSELIGQPVRKFIAESDYELFLRHLLHVRESGETDVCTVGMIRNDSSQFEVRVESNANPAESPSPYRTIYASINTDHQSRTQETVSEFEETAADLSTAQPEPAPLKEEESSTTENIDSHLQLSHDELEKALKQKSTELEDTLKKLEEAVKAREKAEEIAKQHQELLAHVARLNTIGEMTSGLAHEISQPLMAISAYVKSCLNRLASKEDPQQLVGILEQVLVQTKRAANIVNHLRNFVAKGKSHRETINPLKVIASALKMMRSEIVKNKIHFDITHDKNIPEIQADPVQIEQVVLNLVKNAIESMGKVPPEKRNLHIVICNLQKHIGVAVRDTGTGIAKEDEDKICTPFFSTKENGMGLGLAISRTIVEDHGGELSYNTNGNGTTFKFTLAINGQHDPQ
jgi:PAS domain S-box-containing protein